MATHFAEETSGWWCATIESDNCKILLKTLTTSIAKAKNITLFYSEVMAVLRVTSFDPPSSFFNLK